MEKKGGYGGRDVVSCANKNISNTWYSIEGDASRESRVERDIRTIVASRRTTCNQQKKVNNGQVVCQACAVFLSFANEQNILYVRLLFVESVRA